MKGKFSHEIRQEALRESLSEVTEALKWMCNNAPDEFIIPIPHAIAIQERIEKANKLLESKS